MVVRPWLRSTGEAHERYVSAVGKRDSVRLADGSRVILGPASQLVVPAAFGQRGREVELHGEAYFDVVHDTTRPFVVRAGDATIRDIGTSFAVRSDSGPRLQVVVTAGAVALRGRTDSAAILHAGDVGTVAVVWRNFEDTTPPRRRTLRGCGTASSSATRRLRK